MRHPFIAICVIVLLGGSSVRPAVAQAQTSTPQPPLSAQDSIARLSPEEKQQFQAAGQQSNANQFAAALTIYKTLLASHPADPLLSKMASETSMNTGDQKVTIGLLEPIASQNPDDWQATGLLARAYNESGDKARRDAEIARLADLYKKGITPKGLTQYPIERAQVGDKSVIIFNSFEPWGNFKIYNYARVLDSNGKQLMTITLESSDIDQISFAKDHPTEAAAGVRLFSLDGYSEGAVNASGQHSQTHALYGFLNGRPTYDQVRTYFLNLAGGKPAGIMAPNTLTIQPAPQSSSSR